MEEEGTAFPVDLKYSVLSFIIGPQHERVRPEARAY